MPDRKNFEISFYKAADGGTVAAEPLKTFSILAHMYWKTTLTLALVACLTNVSFADQFDPGNDKPPGAKLTAPKVTPTTISGLSLTLNDQKDFYQLFLEPNRSYKVGFGVASLFTGSDPVMTIKDPKGTVVSDQFGIPINKRETGFDTGFTFTTTVGGPFEILVEPLFVFFDTTTITYALVYTDLTGGTGGGGGGGNAGITGTPVLAPQLPLLTIADRQVNGETATVTGSATIGSGADPKTTTLISVSFRTRYQTESWTNWQQAAGTAEFSFSFAAPGPGSSMVQVKATDSDGRDSIPKLTAVKP